mmetsp:Transcript_17932/g.43120  ORF Transcript_17932/g.43120 Transcript_17932/m.43120 type:complete len:115 (+) Transcript_17932:104-448(+)
MWGCAHRDTAKEPHAAHNALTPDKHHSQAVHTHWSTPFFLAPPDRQAGRQTDRRETKPLHDGWIKGERLTEQSDAERMRQQGCKNARQKLCPSQYTHSLHGSEPKHTGRQANDE